ncbi:MAG: sirohydrochlorin cobaltochelatase [Deltaproteobacteria bacterium]|nr:sirohydrochlorin cobaltochelatase [Deltaproteobacteria bacterium]
MKKLSIMVMTLILALSPAVPSFAMGRQKNKKAIVLAGFGTSYPSALVSITNIQKKVRKAFPKVEVRVAFTSNIIRNIWHKRQADARFLSEHKEIPKEILYVKGPLATIADLQDAGYRTIIVQPTHLYNGEEYTDLCSYVRGLNAITTIKKKYTPFVKLVIGRPALGKCGPVYDYHKDMEVAAKALASDVQLAEKEGAALVYMGHGNEFYSTAIYAEFQQVMRRTYPKARIFIGTVEGFPSLADVVSAVTHSRIRKVVLKPLMIVAGDHANNDMAGDDEDSWKNTFKRAGVRVKCVIHGLGENMNWDEIYVNHIKDVARDNDIAL